MNMAGKTILITGGGTGIGAATADVLSTLGANLILLGPDRAPLDDVASRTGAQVLVGDAAEPADVLAALAAARKHFGGLDGLAACAGGGGGGRLADASDEEWRRTMRITLDTARVSARECLPELDARKGSIVFVSSVGGVMAPPAAAAYATAKAALIGLMRSIAHDCGPNVRANALCPGLTRTAMGDLVMKSAGEHVGLGLEEMYAHATRWFPLRRAAEPVEIARIIAFLLSDWSRYMTGSVIVADGGAHAIAPAV